MLPLLLRKLDWGCSMKLKFDVIDPRLPLGSNGLRIFVAFVDSKMLNAKLHSLRSADLPTIIATINSPGGAFTDPNTGNAWISVRPVRLNPNEPVPEVVHRALPMEVAYGASTIISLNPDTGDMTIHKQRYPAQGVPLADLLPLTPLHLW